MFSLKTITKLFTNYSEVSVFPAGCLEPRKLLHFNYFNLHLCKIRHYIIIFLHTKDFGYFTNAILFSIFYFFTFTLLLFTSYFLSNFC